MDTNTLYDKLYRPIWAIQMVCAVIICVLLLVGEAKAQSTDPDDVKCSGIMDQSTQPARLMFHWQMYVLAYLKAMRLFSPLPAGPNVQSHNIKDIDLFFRGECLRDPLQSVGLITWKFADRVGYEPVERWDAAVKQRDTKTTK